MADRRAIVVGSGPNGLMAAIVLARAGWSVEVIEAAERPGGGMRSAELTLPGFVHDVCSAIHPLAIGSTAFRSLAADGVDLGEHGLEWVHPEVPLAHPLDGGRAAVLERSLDDTAARLGADGRAYRRLFGPLVDAGSDLTDGLLDPLAIPPRHPLQLARFGLVGVLPARFLAGRRFDTDEAQALFAGLAGHSFLSLRSPVSAGYGLMLGLLGHLVGWPLAVGGTQSLADAMVGALTDLGGTIEYGRRVRSLSELGTADAVLLDIGPHQLIDIAGDRLSGRARRPYERYRYGPGVFKVDWALDGPIPWTNPDVHRAGTVHVGGTLDEITTAEDDVQRGRVAERPFLLLAQQSRFDPTRAPGGSETAWGYCHVPNGSTVDMTDRIEAQIERFAPGFRDRILARHTMNTAAMEAHDANFIGGDINGGLADLRQFVARPRFALHPWRTPIDGVYLCSASTPPGGGVHGMCGWHAAHDVLSR